jgi:type VI secretion system protein ImpE
MTADELIESGKLSAAIDALEEVLRQRPRDSPARASLFALLGLSNQWERASRQLDAIERLAGRGSPPLIDPSRYRAILSAEMARQRYFTEGLAPDTFGPPGAIVTLTLSIHRLVAGGEFEKVAELFEQFENERKPQSGRLSGEPFDDFRDAEDWMSPVLEVLAPDGYYWVGWDEIQFLDVAAPRSLLDLLWAPARLGLTSSILGAVVVPALYPLSCQHEDELVRLGRRNDWIDVGAGLVRGAGAKVYDVGGRTKALLELQDLSFDLRAEAGP